MSDNKNKEIVVLDEAEHIRLRPTMYVSSVKPTEEKLHIVENGRIFVRTVEMSVGMYKIFGEALDNAFDEARRMKGKMKKIIVNVNSKTNAISVKDTGNGFYKGTQINKASGKTNIETAVSMLRSGSNFKNEESEEAGILGTNGVGVSLTNVLSRRFKITTINDTHFFEKEWFDFKSDDSKTKITKNTTGLETGTVIEFEPTPEVFGKSKWNVDIITSFLY